MAGLALNAYILAGIIIDGDAHMNVFLKILFDGEYRGRSSSQSQVDDIGAALRRKTHPITWLESSLGEAFPPQCSMKLSQGVGGKAFRPLKQVRAFLLAHHLGLFSFGER